MTHVRTIVVVVVVMVVIILSPLILSFPKIGRYKSQRWTAETQFPDMGPPCLNGRQP